MKLEFVRVHIQNDTCHFATAPDRRVWRSVERRSKATRQHLPSRCAPMLSISQVETQKNTILNSHRCCQFTWHFSLMFENFHLTRPRHCAQACVKQSRRRRVNNLINLVCISCAYLLIPLHPRTQHAARRWRRTRQIRECACLKYLACCMVSPQSVAADLRHRSVTVLPILSIFILVWRSPVSWQRVCCCCSCNTFSKSYICM